MNFRVKVDLADFYSDVRRHAYIFLNKDMTTIAAVRDHIRKVFAITDITDLTTGEGIFLAPLESVQIISVGDTIKVRSALKPAQGQRQAHDQLSRDNVFCSNSTILDNCNLPGLFHSTETPIMPAKNKAHLNRGSKIIANGDSSGGVIGGYGSHKGDETLTTVQPAASAADAGKKKRKRSRKRSLKRKNNCDKSQQIEETVPSTPTTLPRPGNGVRASKAQSKVKNSHVMFNDRTSSSSSSSNDDEPLYKKKIICAKEKMPATSRTINGIMTTLTPKLSNGTGQEDVAPKMEVNSITLVDDDDDDEGGREESAFELDRPPSAAQLSVAMDAADFTTNATNLSTTLNSSGASLEELAKNWDSYRRVEELPTKNDIIGFRILTMDEDYTPGLSGPIIGLVEGIDDDNIEIMVLAGKKELKEHTSGGKFSLPDQFNGTLLPEDDADDGLIVLNFRFDMKDVRLVGK